jgi:hypothetical protein
VVAQSLAQLNEEITVEAYDTDEQLSGLPQVFYDFGRLVTWNPAALDVDPA